MIPPIDTSPNAVWKQRYRAPAIQYAGMAANAPERGIVWSNQSGTLQYYTWDVRTGNLAQLTHTPGGKGAFPYLAPDGKWIYYLKDVSGNEVGHFVRIPYAGGDPEDITPDMPPYSSSGFSFSRQGNRLGYFIAAKDGFTLYVVEINDANELSAARRLYHSPTMAGGPFFSADGKVVTVLTTEHTGRNEFSLLALDAQSGEKIAELWEGEGFSLNSPTPSPVVGDSRLVINSNRSGIEQLSLWDPLTGRGEKLQVSEISGAQIPIGWSPDGKQFLFSVLYQAVQSLYLFNFATGGVKKLAAPEGEYQAFFAPDNRLFALWTDAANPYRLVELDPESGNLVRSLVSAGDAPKGKNFRSIHYPSSNGASIQGWLCVPDGPGPFPTILETHGGPAGVQGSGFNPRAQAWVDHGFAFLSINFHGSVTFGREFERSIWGNLGYLELEDMTMAREWLVTQGIADPHAIFLTGWSYGGYLTLLGLGKRPDLWAGGMAGAAIADWELLYEDEADTLRGLEEAFFGCKPSEDPERFRRSSPITYAENVNAPVLIIQGRNDTRTPFRQMEAYVGKLKELGKKVTIHWYEAGHTVNRADVEAGITHQEMMMTFARKALEGG